MITSSPAKIGPGSRHGNEEREQTLEIGRKMGLRIGPADVVGRVVGSVLLAGVIAIGLGVAGRMIWGLGELLIEVGEFLVQRWHHWAIIAVSVVTAFYVFFFRIK